MNIHKLWLCIVFICCSQVVSSNDGEQIYVQCTGCHAFGYHRTGPDHCSILGRVAGSQKGFSYSDVMSNSTVIWSESTLDEFLTAPLGMMPGTTMGFRGLENRDDRLALIAFIRGKAETEECETK